MMERLTGIRYVVPLREGGSLPAVVETDPPGQYVVKFRGAGHCWEGWEDRIQAPFPQIRDHVLLAFAGDLAAADARLGPLLTGEAIRGVVADLPDEWLGDETQFPTLAAYRAAYVTYLEARLHGPRHWLQEAIDAKRRGPVPFAPRLTHRVA